MKKLVALVLVLLSFTSTANALDIDLSGLSLAELIELQQRVTMAMWETEEWQEVEVPVGVYKIGEDIPEGHWTISATRVQSLITLTLAKKLDSTGRNYDWSDMIYTEALTSKDSMANAMLPGQYSDTTDINLSANTYLIVEGGSVIFTPFSGKPSLGFK